MGIYVNLDGNIGHMALAKKKQKNLWPTKQPLHFRIGQNFDIYILL